MDPNAKPAAQPEGEQQDTLTLTRDELAQLVNSAVSSHTKRIESRFEARLTEITKALSTKPAQPEGEQPQGAQQQQAPSDPRMKILEQQLADLKRKSEESETRAQKIERESRQNAVRATLREQLEAKGIKGARARAVLADLEASQSVRYLEDGRVEGVVKRVRTKGGKPEELTHDDLGSFVADWAQSDDAREFLPAPATAPATKPHRAPVASSPPQAPDTSFDGALANAAARLNALGVDPNSAINR